MTDQIFKVSVTKDNIQLHEITSIQHPIQINQEWGLRYLQECTAPPPILLLIPGRVTLADRVDRVPHSSAPPGDGQRGQPTRTRFWIISTTRFDFWKADWNAIVDPLIDWIRHLEKNTRTWPALRDPHTGRRFLQRVPRFRQGRHAGGRVTRWRLGLGLPVADVPSM